MYDTEQISEVFDVLVNKIKQELDDQYTRGRLKGTDYANVYSNLMNTALQLANQSPINESQVNKNNEDILLIKKQEELTNSQTLKTDSERNIDEEQSNKNLVIKDEQANNIRKDTEVKDAQIKFTERQTKGFNDNIKIKLFSAQLGTWGTMFSAGALSEKPKIISDDETSRLYDSFKSELSI